MTTEPPLIFKKSDPGTIKKMFGAIAPKYDEANGILSMNFHKGWNQRLVDKTTVDNPETLLDLCAGTGEIAFTWLNSQSMSKKAILLDFCPEMLKIAEQRQPKLHKIAFVEGDAQKLPFEDQSVDAITMAYGIRNIKDPSLALKEAFRVLKSGGKLGLLELTEPSNKIIRFGHKFYLKNILPTLGGFITKKPEAYKYLSTSIQSFIKPDVLLSELAKAGFKDAVAEPQTFGIAHLFTATKDL